MGNFGDRREVLGQDGGAARTIRASCQRDVRGSNGAPMGLQWDEMGENNLTDLLCVLVFLLILYGIFGVYIIPKRRINDS